MRSANTGNSVLEEAPKCLIAFWMPDFQTSDKRKSTLVDHTKYPVLSYQVSGSIEAMQPAMSIIALSIRSRTELATIHSARVAAPEHHGAAGTTAQFGRLEIYIKSLAQAIPAAKRPASRN